MLQKKVISKNVTEKCTFFTSCSTKISNWGNPVTVAFGIAVDHYLLSPLQLFDCDCQASSNYQTANTVFMPYNPFGDRLLINVYEAP